MGSTSVQTKERGIDPEESAEPRKAGSILGGHANRAVETELRTSHTRERVSTKLCAEGGSTL